MSRTIRRRNKEQPEQFRALTPITTPGVESYRTGWVYRKLSGDELQASLRRFHSEKGRTHGWAPPKCYRKEASVHQRMHDKLELHRFRRLVDCEPIVFSKMPMEYWT